MRLLAIGQWHHFAYMVISMALLGYGAAGSLLFLFFDGIKKHIEGWLVFLSGATAVSFTLAFSLSQKMGLDPLQLIWQPAQWGVMLVTYLLMGLPFLLGGGIVGIILSGSGEKTHRMYAVDLLGAGSGAFLIVPTLYLGPPWHLLPAAGGLVLLGGLYFVLHMRHRGMGVLTILFSACALTLIYLMFPPIPKIHHTKTLPMTLSLPDARVEAETEGPIGTVHVVDSDHIRMVPGLSLNYGILVGKPHLPRQKAIFLDAESIGPITHFSGNDSELDYLDFTTMALPYHIRDPEGVLVVGAGGGTDVLLALRHHTPEIVALETNEQIADLMLGPFSEFSGHLYSRPEVKLEARDARQFMQAEGSRFDLITLSLLDSPVTSAGGLYSATENYLYTTESLSLYLSRLTDSGILAITRWLKLPPRDSLRIITTAMKALHKATLPGPEERHLLFIRSWRTSTILVSKSPFTPEEIERATTFSDERSFDLAYYAGMPVEQANRYDVLNSPDYYMGAAALTVPGANAFIGRYLFDISATTDDRPYFSHFFRWKTAPFLFRQLRKESLPLVDLGFVFILATLVQATFASGLLILLPLLFLRWRRRSSGASKTGIRFFDFLKTGIYFASIGVAFMFLEMALLPKYTLLLSHPVYSAATLLGVVLVFAGLGSMSVRRFQASCTSWFLWIAVAIIFLWVFFQTTIGDRLFALALGKSLGGRIFLAILFLSVLSFFLGWFFPSGLRVLAETNPSLVPWAWGINGCASVIGAVLGKCLAVSIGFRYLMLMACFFYLVALITYHLAFKKVSRPAAPPLS